MPVHYRFRQLFPKPNTISCATFLAFFLFGAGCGVWLARGCAADHAVSAAHYLSALCAEIPTPGAQFLRAARFPVLMLLFCHCGFSRAAASALVFLRGLTLSFTASLCVFCAQPLICVCLFLAQGAMLLPVLLCIYALVLQTRAACPLLQAASLVRMLVCLCVCALAALLSVWFAQA